MKYLILFILAVSFAAIGYGFSLPEAEEVLANKCIGGGTVGIFLIAMPLFLLKESKGKKLKDYMLTEENILKMNAVEKAKDRKPDN